MLEPLHQRQQLSGGKRKTRRVIVHLDMDAFYAQVEGVRLGVDCRTQPYALEQWDNFLAVNYPARDLFNIKRMDSVWVAKQKVLDALRKTQSETQQQTSGTTTAEKEEDPTLFYSSIPVYRIGEEVFQYHAANERDGELGNILHVGPQPQPHQHQQQAAIHPSTHKITLEPFRAASKKIFALLRAIPGVRVAKAGTDEAFLDVTAAAEEDLEKVKRKLWAEQQDQGQHQQQYPNSFFPWTSLQEIKRDILDPTTRMVNDRTPELTDILLQEKNGSGAKSVEELVDGPLRQWCSAHQLSERSSDTDSSTDFFFTADLRPEVRAVERDEPGHSSSASTRLETSSSSSIVLTEVEQEFLRYAALLAAASLVVRRFRDQLYQELRYDCSAGIASNAMLAKLLSASYKPRMQVILWPHLYSSLIGFIRVTKIGGFGGKLGRELTRGEDDVRCVDLWSLTCLPAGTNATRRGSAISPYTFYRIRGIDTNQIADPEPPQSWNSLKDFRNPKKIRQSTQLTAWVPALCHDLLCRHSYHRETYDAAVAGGLFTPILHLRIHQWKQVNQTAASGGGGGGLTLPVFLEEEESSGHGGGAGPGARWNTPTSVFCKRQVNVKPGTEGDVNTLKTLAFAMLEDLLRTEVLYASSSNGTGGERLLNPVTALSITLQYHRVRGNRTASGPAPPLTKGGPTLHDFFQKKPSSTAAIVVATPPPTGFILSQSSTVSSSSPQPLALSLSTTPVKGGEYDGSSGGGSASQPVQILSLDEEDDPDVPVVEDEGAVAPPHKRMREEELDAVEDESVLLLSDDEVVVVD